MTTADTFNLAGKTPQQLGRQLLAELKGGYMAVNTTRALALIDAGASLSETDERGNTALHLTAIEGLPKIAKKISEQQGVDINALNNLNETALLIALQPPPDLERSAEDFHEVATVLLQKKARVNTVNTFKDTPLLLAAGQQLFTFVKDILAADPAQDLEQRDRNNETAIEVARRRNAAPVVGLIEEAYKTQKLMAHQRHVEEVADVNRIMATPVSDGLELPAAATFRKRGFKL